MSAARARGLVRFSIVVAAVVVVAIVFTGSRYGILFGHTESWPHTLQMTVPEAFEAIPGERMVAGGITVGEITKANVTQAGQAHLVMGIDNAEWPIPSDSVLTLRMGGTIKYTDRYISITKGSSGSDFANDASVPARQFIVPVEYDQLFDVFNTATRRNLKRFFAETGPTLTDAVTPFHRALPVAPPVLAQTSAVFQDLGYNEQALSTLVSSTAQVSDAVASANPGVQTLIEGAANTFGAAAARAGSLRHAVAIASLLFHSAGVALSDLSTVGPSVLVKAAVLARRLNPGVTQLTAMAPSLNGTLREVVNVEPTAVSTLSTVKRSGPAIDTLLTKARTELLPQLTSISDQSATELACVRPYTPDLMDFIQNWAGWMGDGLNDPHIHIFHAEVSAFPFPNEMPITPEQLHQLLPDLEEEDPMPPGMAWNQPWYQPQCGSSPTIDTSAGDSEAGTFDPNGSKLVPFSTITPTYSPAQTIPPANERDQ